MTDALHRAPGVAAHKTPSTPILPKDAADINRWRETSLRRRMLDGNGWAHDARVHMSRHLDPTRLDAWGPPALGVNLFASYIAQLTLPHRDHPTLTHSEPLSDEQEAYVADLPIWHQHLSQARYLAGLGECLMRVSWLPGNQAADPGMHLRLVTPEYVTVMDAPTAPGVPLRIEEAVERAHPDTGVKEWTWDVWSIEDPAAPYFRIESGDDKRKDLTAIYAPDQVGRWDWKDEAGPYLPWVLGHSMDLGTLWNYWVWDALICGTLDVVLLFSFYVHIVRDASWAQKYGVNVKLRGLSKAEQGKETRAQISTDPASLLLFESENGQAGNVGVLEPSAKPAEVIESIRSFIAVIAMNMGLSAADLEKSQAESGVAIQLRYDAIRRLQKVYLPGLRQMDKDLVEMVARVSNQFAQGAPTLPTDGWQVTYPSIPLTREEQTERLDIRERELALGLINRVDLYLERHPELTRDDAIAKMVELHAESRLLPI